MAKCSVEDGVDDRVDGGADVPQPEADVYDGWLEVVWRHEREEHVQDEERGPQDHKRKEHYSEHFAGFLFSGNVVAETVVSRV